MAKKFTIKKNRLRSRARRRKQSLKVNPLAKGIKLNQEQRNLDVIRSLEAKIKVVAAG